MVQRRCPDQANADVERAAVVLLQVGSRLQAPGSRNAGLRILGGLRSKEPEGLGGIQPSRRRDQQAPSG